MPRKKAQPGSIVGIVFDPLSTMHEDFERSLWYCFMYLTDLFQRKFTCQDHLTEACFGQELHLSHGTVVHLRTSVEGNRREVQAEQAHVLHDEGIHPYPVQIPNHPFGFGEFLVLQDGVEGHVDADITQMGILHQLGNVFQRVACRGPCIAGDYLYTI